MGVGNRTPGAQTCAPARITSLKSILRRARPPRPSVKAQTKTNRLSATPVSGLRPACCNRAAAGNVYFWYVLIKILAVRPRHIKVRPVTERSIIGDHSLCRWLSGCASRSQAERLKLLVCVELLSYEDEQERETDAPELFPCLPNGSARCRASSCVGLHAWLPRETSSAARTADLVSRHSGDTWMALDAD